MLGVWFTFSIILAYSWLGWDWVAFVPGSTDQQPAGLALKQPDAASITVDCWQLARRSRTGRSIPIMQSPWFNLQLDLALFRAVAGRLPGSEFSAGVGGGGDPGQDPGRLIGLRMLPRLVHCCLASAFS